MRGYCQICGKMILRGRAFKAFGIKLKICDACFDILEKYIKAEDEVKEILERLDTCVLHFKNEVETLCNLVLQKEIEIIRKITKTR